MNSTECHKWKYDTSIFTSTVVSEVRLWIFCKYLLVCKGQVTPLANKILLLGSGTDSVWEHDFGPETNYIQARNLVCRDKVCPNKYFKSSNFLFWEVFRKFIKNMYVVLEFQLTNSLKLLNGESLMEPCHKELVNICQ